MDVQDVTVASAPASAPAKLLSVRAIDARVHLDHFQFEGNVSGGDFKPYQPNPRPWLVVIEVVGEPGEGDPPPGGDEEEPGPGGVHGGRGGATLGSLQQKLYLRRQVAQPW